MEEQLPIHEILPQVKNSLLEQNTIIVQAPPGAGKSTILPIKLLNENWLAGKKIIMLEPRRIAARSVANRMAKLLNEDVGQTIGYRIRFESKISAKTKIEVVTEGILTRILQNDNTLENVGCIIFDEFHERSLHADLALALTRETQHILRNDLKIIIMSATLDGETLSTLLGNAPIITSKGRQYPIEIKYVDEDPREIISSQVARLIKIVLQKHNGDVLAFLPGAAEIVKTHELLANEHVLVYPLYGDLPQHEQQLAITPDVSGRRKVILATSIAETSLTIDGVKIVVDCGYSRVPQFDLRTGLTKLKTIRVTKDTADQRAGRAGRMGPGIAYRLWNEALQNSLLQQRKPEILEADLAPTLLEITNWGERDVNKLLWLSPPPASSISQAKELLYSLEAIDELGQITERGKKMLQFPTHPRIAHMIIESQSYNLLSLATDVTAILDERDVLSSESGANITQRVELLRNWRNKEKVNADKKKLERIERNASVWRKILNTISDNSTPADENVGKLIAAAYPERIAKRVNNKGKYRLANGRFAKLNEHDELTSYEYIAIAQMDAGNNEGKIFLAAPLNKEDVDHTAQTKNNISWDKEKGMIIAQREWCIGAIVLKTESIKEVSNEMASTILLNVVKDEWNTILNHSSESILFQARVISVKKWSNNNNIPDFSDEGLKSSIENWLLPFISHARKRDDFKKLNLTEIFKSYIPWNEQQLIEKLAPEYINVPSGSKITIQYFKDDSTPVLAVRLQELFGMLETPTINNGQIKLMLHLLSPAYRPVQVTQDLGNFWKNTYHEVKKELKIRYPKHSWPDDPITAKAVRGIVKKRASN